MIDVVEHVEDCYGFLRRLRMRADFKVFHMPLDFSEETALATLIDTGYEIVDVVYLCPPLELPNRGWKADLMRIPRRVVFAINRDLSVRVFGGSSLLVLTR